MGLGKSIKELKFERDWTLAKLRNNWQDIPFDRRNELIDNLEKLDIEIAASRSKSIGDIAIKIERYITLKYGSPHYIVENKSSDLIIKSIWEDINVMKFGTK